MEGFIIKSAFSVSFLRYRGYVNTKGSIQYGGGVISRYFVVRRIIARLFFKHTMIDYII